MKAKRKTRKRKKKKNHIRKKNGVQYMTYNYITLLVNILLK